MGDWLKIIRKERGLTQNETAQQANIKQPTYCNIENGERRPSPEVAKKIAAALNFESYGLDWTKFFEEELSAEKNPA